MKAIIYLLLVACASVGFLIVEPISFIYVVFVKRKFTYNRLCGYLHGLAYEIDKFLNHQYRSLFGAIWIRQDGYQFGNFDQTISYVLGRNQLQGSLTRFGWAVVWILDKIEKDHCIKAVNIYERRENENRTKGD